SPRRTNAMRLSPGISVSQAYEVLRRAEMTWINALGALDLYRAYTDAVHDTFPILKQAFAIPDVGGSLRSTAYWNLLQIGGARSDLGFFSDLNVAANVQRALRAENRALTTEI